MKKFYKKVDEMESVNKKIAGDLVDISFSCEGIVSLLDSTVATIESQGEINEFGLAVLSSTLTDNIRKIHDVVEIIEKAEYERSILDDKATESKKRAEAPVWVTITNGETMTPLGEGTPVSKGDKVLCIPLSHDKYFDSHYVLTPIGSEDRIMGKIQSLLNGFYRVTTSMSEMVEITKEELESKYKIVGSFKKVALDD